MEEDFVRVKTRYNAPIFSLVALLFAPIVIIAAQFSGVTAAVVALLGLGIGWGLESGSPPVYEVVLMVVTSLIPVGYPMYNLFVDGTGRVEIINPFSQTQKEEQ